MFNGVKGKGNKLIRRSKILPFLKSKQYNIIIFLGGLLFTSMKGILNTKQNFLE